MTGPGWATAARVNRTSGGLFGCLAGDGVDLDPGVADVAQTLPGIALEAAPEQAANPGRSLGRERLEIDLGLEHRGQDVRDGLSGEQLISSEHFEEHHAEGPDVAALVDRFAAGLLGRHVGGGVEDEPGGGAGLGKCGGLGQGATPGGSPGTLTSPGLGEAEVEYLDLAVRVELYIGRFEVAVDDALFVRRLETFRDLARDVQGLSRRSGSSDISAGRTLMATGRPSLVSCAFYTTPMPPSPICLSRR